MTVRFSVSAGIPTIADNDANGSSPQAMAVRFHLGDHVHTDIIAHSHSGFPTRTGEEFLSPEQAKEKTADFLAAEMSERLARGPAEFRVLVQVAEDGDEFSNATAIWPETRQLVDFGTVTVTERVDELSPERRKIIFDPVPRVDGIESAGDPLTEVCSDLYLLSGRRRRKEFKTARAPTSSIARPE